MTHFVWFWTFWHWSKESFRSGASLRAPLEGIGGHWDEWFRHEAQPNDLRMMEAIGADEAEQRQFIAWLYRHWLPESDWRGQRVVPEFMLGQLLQHAPFNEWAALNKYRAGHGFRGLSTLVLGEGSEGEPEDVRALEVIAVPLEHVGQPLTATEGFRTEQENLEVARQATLKLLCGRGLFIFLAWWIIGGQRPYPNWLKVTLATGWLAVIGLILFLLFGPDPGRFLRPVAVGLTGLWSFLVLVPLLVISIESFRAWRAGRFWGRLLARSQIRFRMNCGLTLKGGSAGLAFCLNTLSGLYHAGPQGTRGSWLWERFFSVWRARSHAWAATGAVTAGGTIQSVVLAPKIRACVRHGEISSIFTPPGQSDSEQTSPTVAEPNAAGERKAPASAPVTERLGFAAEKHRLQIRPCRTVARCLMTIGNFSSPWQIVMSGIAILTSAVMLATAPDLRAMVFPYAAPAVVAPTSPSPYYLWVSLDTTHPRYFQVVLESQYWANRQVGISSYTGTNGSVRAEIALHRAEPDPVGGELDGIIWVERRQRFLTREYLSGERLGRYTVHYINGLDDKTP